MLSDTTSAVNCIIASPTFPIHRFIIACALLTAVGTFAANIRSPARPVVSNSLANGFAYYPGNQYPTTRSSITITCRPPGSSGTTGICVSNNNLNQKCVNLEIAISTDCNALSNSLCCYGASIGTTTIPVQSTAGSTVTPLSLFQNAMIATVEQQTCGIPNGDPSLFTSLELPAVKKGSAVPSRPGRLRSVFKGSGVHTSRFIVHETIIGGFDAPNGSGSICWQVATLRTSLGPDGNAAFQVACAGTIVGSRTILTAAHCPIDTTVADFNSSANPTTVQIGVIAINPFGPPFYTQVVANCSRSYNVSKTIVHPAYNTDVNDNDIALLILSEPIDFRKHSACACKACLSSQAPAVGDTCITSGFGSESTTSTPRNPIPLKYVQQAVLPPLYDGSCAYFESLTGSGQVTDLDLYLCCGGVVGQDACQGDSGGPLFCYNQTTKTQYLAGITSSGDSCAIGEGALFTKVSAYNQWIFENAPLGDISIMV